ncbi:MAG: GldG family protein [Oscillospiraceae bacterium]|nr:GldG family protein [Oscillospiraceae bacterium]
MSKKKKKSAANNNAADIEKQAAEVSADTAEETAREAAALISESENPASENTEAAEEAEDTADGDVEAAADEKAEAEVHETEKKESTEKSEEDSEKAAQRRYNRRRLKYGSVATAITVVVIAVVVMINVAVNLAGEKVNMSIDLTENGTFEISQESIDYLAKVNEPVSIVCMSDELTFQTSNYIYFKQAYEVLKKYTFYNDNVTLKFVNMVEDPTYADRYSSSYKGNIDAYSIVVESSKRIKVLTIQDLYNTELNYQTFREEVVSSKAEQELTSAIMYVTDPDPLQAVIFNSETSGSSYDNVASLMVSNGYDVTEINPLTEEIPEDTDIVVVNAPLNDYETDIVDKLYKFLDNNGNLGKSLIYIADYSQKETANIDAFLAEWGIKVEQGVVGDDDANNLQSQSFYIVRDYISENDFSGNVAQPALPVIDYQSRPVTLLFETKDTRSTAALLQTKETGFVMTDSMQEEIRNGGSPEIAHGAQTTMAIGRKYIFDDNNAQVFSNVLVVGSSETLDEAFTGQTYYNNGDYFVSVLTAMTGKSSGISIVAKDLSSPTFDIDMASISSYITVFMIVIPLAVLVIGGVVFFRRRTK